MNKQGDNPGVVECLGHEAEGAEGPGGELKGVSRWSLGQRDTRMSLQSSVAASKPWLSLHPASLWVCNV